MYSGNDIPFVAQKFLRQVEITAAGLRLFNDDLIGDSSGSAAKQTDTVGEQYRLVNIVSDKERRQLNAAHDIKIPAVHIALCESIKSAEGFVKQSNVS